MFTCSCILYTHRWNLYNWVRCVHLHVRHVYPVISIPISLMCILQVYSVHSLIRSLSMWVRCGYVRVCSVHPHAFSIFVGLMYTPVGTFYTLTDMISVPILCDMYCCKHVLYAHIYYLYTHGCDVYTYRLVLYTSFHAFFYLWDGNFTHGDILNYFTVLLFTTANHEGTVGPSYS